MNYSPMPLGIETERLVLTPEGENDVERFTDQEATTSGSGAMNTWMSS